MKIKQLYQWQMINNKKSLLIFYTIIYSIYLFSIVISKITGDIRVGGMDTSSAIYMFIAGLLFFNETFKFALCNGVSRKTVLVTQIGTILSLSVVMTLIDTLNRWLFSLIVNKQNLSISYDIYGDKGIFATLLWTFSIYLLFGIFGHFIGTLNSRLTKLMKMVVYIPIPVILFVILPLIVSILSESARVALFKFINNVFDYLTANPYNMMLIALIISVVFYIFSILLVRKAPLKTA